VNVMIVGLGSMGKRRLRLLVENYKESCIIGVDPSSERRKQVIDQYGIICFDSIHDAINNTSAVNAAFVCTPPVTHAAIIQVLLESEIHVFSELNLISDGYLENIGLAEKKGRILFLSSTFLYRDETRFLIRQIQREKTKLTYTYHVGQYLPDWHPWESYQDFFVTDVRSNGCREIFAIELPWLVQAFGKVSGVIVSKDTISSLSLPYPDSFLVLLEHESGHRGQFMVDVVARIPIRHFEVFGEKLQIEWRGTPEQLWIADERFSEMQKVDLKHEVSGVDGYHSYIVEDAYLKEIEEFIAVCNGKKHTAYSFSDDLYTLALIDRIEGQRE